MDIKTINYTGAVAEFLEALSDKTTGGPWMIDQEWADGFAPWVKAPSPDDHEPLWVCGFAAMGGDEEQNNAALTIGLRNSLPTILSALRRVEKMERALEKAEQFIVNGTELGFIRMPEAADDPAHLTLPAIRQALTGEA